MGPNEEGVFSRIHVYRSKANCGTKQRAADPMRSIEALPAEEAHWSPLRSGGCAVAAQKREVDV